MKKKQATSELKGSPEPIGAMKNGPSIKGVANEVKANKVSEKKNQYGKVRRHRTQHAS